MEEGKQLQGLLNIFTYNVLSVLSVSRDVSKSLLNSSELLLAIH